MHGVEICSEVCDFDAVRVALVDRHNPSHRKEQFLTVVISLYHNELIGSRLVFFDYSVFADFINSANLVPFESFSIKNLSTI